MAARATGLPVRLFEAPTENWLQTVFSDPKAQGWGAWRETEKTPLVPGGGGGREEQGGEAEEDDRDASFLLSLLELENLDKSLVPDQMADVHRLGEKAEAEAVDFLVTLLSGLGGLGGGGHRASSTGPRASFQPVLRVEIASGPEKGLSPLGPRPSGGAHELSHSQAHHGREVQELDAIKLKLWGLEQAEERLEPPGVQGKTREEEGPGAGQPLGTETVGCPFSGTPKEKMEADHRSIYVGNVDYGGTAKELEAHFHHCGEVHRVTILCDKFSGHPKGYAYIEFATKSSAQAAIELDESVFRGRVLKVLPKRTNFPGISSTDRGGLRVHPGSRAAAFLRGGLQGRGRFSARGQNWVRGRASPRFSPY